MVNAKTPWMATLHPTVEGQRDRGCCVKQYSPMLLEIQWPGLNQQSRSWPCLGSFLGHSGFVSRRTSPPNTYEAPGCQGTKISSQRFFCFFPPGACQHCWPSATCSDLISHAGAPTWLHQTLLEVRSPRSWRVQQPSALFAATEKQSGALVPSSSKAGYT